jgi:hypothetical protein
MISVFKRELVGYFKNATAYVIFAIYTFLSAMFFCRFVLLNNTSYLGELFGYYLFLVEIVVVSILAMRFFSEEKKNKTEHDENDTFITECCNCCHDCCKEVTLNALYPFEYCKVKSKQAVKKCCHFGFFLSVFINLYLPFRVKYP